MLAALVCSLVPAPADAHAYLDHSNPADGSTLTAAPRTLRLEFSEHVVLRATHIEVVDGDGTVVPVTGLRLVTADPDDTEEPAGIVATLPRLAQNTYRVSLGDAVQRRPAPHLGHPSCSACAGRWPPAASRSPCPGPRRPRCAGWCWAAPAWPSAAR